jgi:ankyrin repeat protein
MKSINELDKSLNYYNRKSKKHNESDTVIQPKDNKLNCLTENQDQFEEFTKQLYFFESIACGEDRDIEDIIKIVKNDPRRSLYDKKGYYINKKNHEGFTPLYIACLNGHAKIVDILLKYDADYLELCGVKFFNIGRRRNGFSISRCCKMVTYKSR